MSKSDDGRKRLTYVTDLERTPSGGGACVVNWHAFRELEKRFDAHYAGPIVPRRPVVGDLVSKVRRRVLNLPGKYSYFSPQTLDENARIAHGMFAPASDAIVFRSAARWCRCRPEVPYFVYLDAVIHTFFHNTFDESDFAESDLQRIWDEETAFLENAAGVFFESEWGLRKAREAYSLEGSHYRFAGRGAAIEPPSADTWDGESRSLVTLAMNFTQKGGDIVAAAFAQLKPRYPSLTWHIIGAKPDFASESIDGVRYEGVLSPEHDLERLTTILANAFLCVHPTREDTSPLVITEAAYFGCPSISMNSFAIPELIPPHTGLLLDPPPDAERLANAIESLLLDRDRYLSMRRAAREYHLANFRWERAGATICDNIEKVIAGR